MEIHLIKQKRGEKISCPFYYHEKEFANLKSFEIWFLKNYDLKPNIKN